MFKDYLIEQLTDTDKLQYNYNGISRKDFPKWAGWKVISKHKANGIDIKEIKDSKLDILVENFYYLKYISEL
jgi:hypothetical protein